MRPLTLETFRVSGGRNFLDLRHFVSFPRSGDWSAPLIRAAVMVEKDCRGWQGAGVSREVLRERQDERIR